MKARPSAKLDFLCSTFGFLVQLLMPFLVLYFRFSRATSGALSRALLSVFSCNFSCPFSWSTFGFLVQLLVPFLVVYFRFSRATSRALSRALSRAFFLLLVRFHVLFGPTSFDYLSPDSNSPLLRHPCFCQFARATSGAISRAPLQVAFT